MSYDFYGYVSPAFQYTIHCRNAAASAAAAGVRQGFQGGNMQGNQVDTHTPSSWPDTLAVTAPSRPEGPAVTHLRGRDTGHLFTAVISATGAALLSWGQSCQSRSHNRPWECWECKDPVFLWQQSPSRASLGYTSFTWEPLWLSSQPSQQSGEIVLTFLLDFVLVKCFHQAVFKLWCI